MNGDSTPCVIFEDADLLVVNKPPGLNTHSPSPFAGEGIYDWLRNREPRWASLAIVHRLDKETSGVMVFGKTAAANRSLTQQFENRLVAKRYLLWTERSPRARTLEARTGLRRAGEFYAVVPAAGAETIAETRFTVLETRGRFTVVAAEPRTGRTHQIRAHAAHLGFPIHGDVLYGGAAAGRVFLHAERIRLRHPTQGDEREFIAPVDFERSKSDSLRAAIIDPAATSLYRVVHGEADGFPGWFVDRVGEHLLSQSDGALSDERRERIETWARSAGLRGVYHKTLRLQPGETDANEAAPRLIWGEPAAPEFSGRENGVAFSLSFNEGYSIGLFFDQRDNRRRLLTRWVAPEFSLENVKRVCNGFAYTCGFSTCAALAGMAVTSIDLSRNYLEWGKKNFVANGIDPAGHDFIYGDMFDWLKRFGKKGRRFDLVILDPPTFSRSRERGVFRVEKDFEELAAAALAVIEPGGFLFCSTNSARLEPERFLAQIEGAFRETGRRIAARHYVPQPPDFPVSKSEPAYLKTVWLRVE